MKRSETQPAQADSADATQSGGATLHRRILEDIEHKIVSGEWPVGFRIPFEVSLAEHYGCSRMTVNKVLSQLSRAGLINRVKRSGSFVSQPHSQSAVLEINDIRREVESLKVPYGFALRGSQRRKASEADLDLLDVEAGSPLIELDCLHFANARPFCHERRLISLSAVPGAAGVDFATNTPSQWLLSQVPWTSAEHRIHADAADRAMAETLAIAEGAACLVVERRTWGPSGPVTHVRLTYPGDRHALVARFTPSS